MSEVKIDNDLLERIKFVIDCKEQRPNICDVLIVKSNIVTVIDIIGNYLFIEDYFKTNPSKDRITDDIYHLNILSAVTELRKIVLENKIDEFNEQTKQYDFQLEDFKGYRTPAPNMKRIKSKNLTITFIHE